MSRLCVTSCIRHLVPNLGVMRWVLPGVIGPMSVLSVLLGAGSVVAENAAQEEEQTITKEVGVNEFPAGVKFLVTKELYPTAERKGLPVEIRFYGNRYDPPRELPPVTKTNWTATTPLESIRALVSSWQAGEKEWIITTWSPKERSDIRTRSEDEKVFEKSRDFFLRIEKVRIIEEVYYGEYVILRLELNLISGKKLVRPYTVKKVDARWLLTNEPGRDPFYIELLSVLGRETAQVKTVPVANKGRQ